MKLLRPFRLLFSAGASLATIAVASCGGDIAQPNAPGGSVVARELLVWRDSATSGTFRPVYDEISVYNFDASLHQASAVNKLTGVLQWKRKVIGDHSFRRGQAMVLAGDVLVVGDYELVGINPVNGETLWNSNNFVDSPSSGRIATDGTTLFIGTLGGSVVGLDSRSGAKLWSVRADTGRAPMTDVYSPVFRDGVIYARYVTTTFVANGLGSIEGVVAIDAQSQTLLWNTQFAGNQFPRPLAALAGVGVTANLVVLPAANGSVYGLDRRTGAVLLRRSQSEAYLAFNIAGIEEAKISADDNVIVLASMYGSLSALSTDDLHRLWGVNLNHGPPPDVVLDGQLAYTSHQNGDLLATRISDGSLAWMISDGTFRSDGRENIFSGPAIDGTRLFFGGEREVYSLTR